MITQKSTVLDIGKLLGLSVMFRSDEEAHDCMEITHILCMCVCFQLTCTHSSVKFKSWVATMLSQKIGCGNQFMMT